MIIQVGAPIPAAVSLADVALGFVARAVPRLNLGRPEGIEQSLEATYQLAEPGHELGVILRAHGLPYRSLKPEARSLPIPNLRTGSIR